MNLSIGTSVFDDYNGIYFTIQSLRMHHNLTDAEFIVIDNNPDSKQGTETKKFVENDVKGKYIPYSDKQSTFTKYEALKYASRNYYLGLDCHVMLMPNAINELMHYFVTNPECKNLVQGPLIYDDIKSISTHFKPEWSGGMYGTWQTDERYKQDDPFSIPMNGMGLFACETRYFPQINQNFKGFGGEEWYFHEKIRRNGGHCICLPQLQWLHRFNRPDGIPYINTWEDRLRNYYIAWWELYPDVNHPMILSIEEHFKQYLSMDKINEIFEEVINL
jgi:hypothetical protein